MIKGYIYRGWMRLIHRFNHCWMRPQPQIESGKSRLWCTWCGNRHVVIEVPPHPLPEQTNDS